jgi:hypothetical protein
MTHFKDQLRATAAVEAGGVRPDAALSKGRRAYAPPERTEVFISKTASGSHSGSEARHSESRS